jgi:hypothetical protein
MSTETQQLWEKVASRQNPITPLPNPHDKERVLA